MKKILVLSHFNYSHSGAIHGPVDTILSYLERNKQNYDYVAYPLYAGRKGFRIWFDGNKKKESSFGTSLKMPLPVKSILETGQTIRFGFSHPTDLIIAIDPLNAVAAVLLKKLGKTKQVVFYTVDYTPTRFANSILNSIYHLLDRVCVKNADYVWNVSSRIVKVREQMGLDNEHNVFVPNAPSFKVATRMDPSKMDRFKVMMVTGLTHTPVFDMLVEAVKVVAREFPKFSLSLIGGGSYGDDLKDRFEKIGLGDKVHFLGQLDHASLLKVLPTGGLGLAIYTLDYSWTYYGDSMKAREYLAAGLPVIISDVVSTADDIAHNKAGLVIKPDQEALIQSLRAVLKDKTLWLGMRRHAIELAEKYDTDQILNNVLGELLHDEN